MSKFSAFMAENVTPLENRKIVISNRFKDENGKPIEWEIRAITSDENDELMRRAMVNVQVAGRRGQFTRELDNVKYTNMLMAASVVYPNLNDAELQDSYKVKTPEELLKKMLYPKEENLLAETVVNFSDLPEINDLIEEAKN